MDFGAAASIGGFEERIVATVDGLAIYVRDYPPLEPATGLPVIVLHGLTRNSRDFEVIAPRIAALGRRVLAPDMRGRGRSANDPDPAHYVPAVYAQDVLRLMEALEIPKAVFVGTSMGVLITMTLAMMAPDRIAASVLNDTGPRLGMQGLSRIASYVGHIVAVDDWDAAAAVIRDINGPAFPDRADDGSFWLTFARRTFRVREDGKLELDYDPHIALSFADLEEDGPAIDLSPLFQALAAKPVLSVRGAISDILTEDTVALMRALKPDLEAVAIENIGHAPTLEEPEAWDAVLDFLARVE
ncbi:MAG: alpha/beta hydrolase [Hyphomonadaceae bacterium]|nr:alpha/beta hydrolase [Hyphomonadaceae bacterium]MBX3510840.1 alpha/beta hydrolase [Hyphomonadaceae bacterium]